MPTDCLIEDVKDPNCIGRFLRQLSSKDKEPCTEAIYINREYYAYTDSTSI